MTAVKRRKKISFYKDPYIPPGYSGYSSQLPFQFGATYGTITNRLLCDPNVAKSGRSVLVDLEPPIEAIRERESEKEKWVRRRNKSWGDVKMNEQMVPGYTAFIPRTEEHFGARYAEICERGILDHNKDRIRYENNMKSLAELSKPPMQAIRREPEPYLPLGPVTHPESPYFMKTDDPKKFFISGFTGCVPKAFERFGQGYPILTNRALVNFTRSQDEIKSREGTPVRVQRPPTTRIDPDNIDSEYHIINCNGLIPNYTGHMPGHRFRQGLTYGASSRYCHSESNFCRGRLPIKL